jgi:peptide/nickel transport system ATP-binding protein/oligopeptide transport system ATP-binding protein
MGDQGQRALLEIRNLRTYVPTRGGIVRAVDGVDLSVQAGRTLCVVGESGSGKSLTALSVMGLIDKPVRIMPGSEVWFGGRELTAMPPRELTGLRGDELSMIFQDPMSSLNPLFSVGSQIAETVRRHTGAGRRKAWDRAVELLRLVGVPSPETRARDFPYQLSGGMLQRAMIAMALSCEPRLLIADEPTTALDVTIQAQILELLRDLQSSLGMGILLITHDFGVVAQMADEVAVMYAGQVVERGPAAGLLRHPQHPYTEALLRSVPVLGMNSDEPLEVIPGTVPSPLAWPPGCRFEARCAHAFARCGQAAPPLVRVSGDREAACWLRDGEAASQPVTAREGQP